MCMSVCYFCCISVASWRFHGIFIAIVVIIAVVVGGGGNGSFRNNRPQRNESGSKSKRNSCVHM